MIKKLINWFRKSEIVHTVIPRAEHGISRQRISKNALKVLYRLHNAGYSAYLVGGCIRDLLLDIQPKDFDIATNAEPEEIRKLFSNCRIIGRRFRLAHVHFGRDILEVATFRAPHSASTIKNNDGMILRDNEFGSIKEDVMRRDFTVNALYYNIADFSVEDFVGGMEDVKKRQLCLIGDPELRYKEDPVRMLRAIRFAAKLKFKIHPDTAKPILLHSHLLSNIPAARLFEEYSKLFLSGNALETYKLLCEYRLFERLFPLTAKYLPDNSLIENALRNTDARYAAEKSITPSFLLAVLLWHPLVARTKHYMSEGMSEFDASSKAIDKILGEQQRVMSVPRRFTSMVRDVWELQIRLERKRSARNVMQMFALAKFRAAYDFLLLRAESGEKHVVETAAWWQNYVEGDSANREALEANINSVKRKSKRKFKPKAKPADIKVQE
jgi:poly(A) polymerase